MLSTIRFCIGRISCNGLMHSSTYREGRMLQKMIKKAEGKGNFFKRQPMKLAVEILSKPYQNEGNNRRTIALNKIYMEKVAEAVEANESCLHLLDLGFQVTKVKLSNCQSSLYIYWILPNQNTTEEAFTQLLSKAHSELQQELGSLKYSGRIPKINFVRDISLERGLEVEKILESSELKKEIEYTHPDKVYSEFDNKPGENLPEMKQNILGLDHNQMTQKIRGDMERHKVFSPKGQFEQANVAPGPLISFDKNEFKKFYRRKKYLDRKMEDRVITKSQGKTMEDFNEVIPEDVSEQDWEYVEDEGNDLGESDPYDSKKY